MEKMLIFVDSKNNNNKFYHLSLSGEIVNIRYGRVGTDGSKTSKVGGVKTFNKVLREKINKGYVESEILLEGSTQVSNTNLLDIVLSQISFEDDKIRDLLERLVQKNIHQITSSSAITFNKGVFSTPLGPVTLSGIQKAKKLLSEISKLVVKKDFKQDFLKKNEEYFKIIPTKIKNLRNTDEYMLISSERIEKQFELCDMLESALNLIVEQPKKDIEVESVFNVKIKMIDKNSDIFNNINDKFEKTKNDEHGRRVTSLKIKNIYEVDVNDENKNFIHSSKNIWSLWHGTRVSNILSIFKSGLLMPKETPGRKTGAMFGNGLYFSDQSTKSLNYCDGMLWNNESSQDKVYMFLADVAMGNYYTPTNSTSSNPPKGYDSYFAEAKKSNVRNNEMIVFDLKRVRLRYLLELSY